jgi:hypothetical protein
MTETTYRRRGAPDRGIRVHQRAHIVPLPQDTRAWITTDRVEGPFMAVAAAIVAIGQSWSIDTALVREPEGPSGRQRHPYETAAAARRFVPRDPKVLMEEAPMWVLLLLPDGPEWVSEDSVFFDQTAAESWLGVSGERAPEDAP